jgi:hypothetical protein
MDTESRSEEEDEDEDEVKGVLLVKVVRKYKIYQVWSGCTYDTNIIFPEVVVERIESCTSYSSDAKLIYNFELYSRILFIKHTLGHSAVIR